MKVVFEQQSELQVAKWLIVHVLSRSYNVFNIELRNKGRATQQWNLRVRNDILVNRVRVYHESVYVDNFVSKFWFVRSFASQYYSNFLADITSKKVSQFRIEEGKIACFTCKVNLNFFRSSRHFSGDRAFGVIVIFE